MFSSFMTNTWIVATVIAVLAGVVGFFVVLRGSAFPAHAIPNSAFAGAAAANIFGFSALLGLAGAAGIAAFGIATLGRRGRHDVVTAFVLVLGLAIGAIFLTRSEEYEPQLYSLLFGEVLGVSTTELLPVALLAIACIAAIVLLYRPLLLSSVVPEVAESKGVSSYGVELAFLLVLAAATALTVPVVGALLIFSLMIGPPAAARSFTVRPPLAILLSVIIALVTVWAAIASSYASNWPVGFFVGVFSAFAYTIGRLWARWRRSRTIRSRVSGGHPPGADPHSPLVADPSVLV
jgi:zinc/manganese transport system permease protein